MAMDLATDFCGIRFRNPIIVPAGTHGRDGETIREVSKSGVAGICTKTIVAQPAPDVLPCFVKVSAGMLNAVFGTDKPMDYWFCEGDPGGEEGRGGGRSPTWPASFPSRPGIWPRRPRLPGRT